MKTLFLLAALVISGNAMATKKGNNSCCRSTTNSSMYQNYAGKNCRAGWTSTGVIQTGPSSPCANLAIGESGQTTAAK